MAGSLTPQVKSALVAALQARPGLDGVQVQYADSPQTARRERIYLGDVEDADHEPASMRQGRRRRYEEATLHVWVQVLGKSPEAAEARAFALLAEVEETLADDPRLGVLPPNSWTVFAGFQATTLETTQGSEARIDARITWKASLL